MRGRNASPQTGLPEKVYVLIRQRLLRREGDRFRPGGSDEGDVAYRLGYYTVARNGKWWWGQFSVMLPVDDLLPLLRQARAEGTLLGEPELV